MGISKYRKPNSFIFLCLFNTWLKNRKMLKNTGYFVNEDFSDETIAKRKELFKEMKKQRQLGKFSIATSYTILFCPVLENR